MRPACSVDCGQAQRLRLRQQARTVEIARHFRRNRLPRRNMWRDIVVFGAADDQLSAGMMVSDAWTGEQSLHVPVRARPPRILDGTGRLQYWHVLRSDADEPELIMSRHCGPLMLDGP